MATAVDGGFMADLYTCICGNQTWQIFETGVRCATCQSEFVTQHQPVTEFNRTVTREMEEELEEV
jgi:ribosomal protein L37AE/L43A